MSPFGILDNGDHHSQSSAWNGRATRSYDAPEQGRRSLSELDQDAVRRGIAAYMAANSRPGNGTVTNDTAHQQLRRGWTDGPANYSHSQTPTALNNGRSTLSRPAHPRHSSAAAQFPTRDEESLLKPPPRTFTRPVPEMSVSMSTPSPLRMHPPNLTEEQQRFFHEDDRPYRGAWEWRQSLPWEDVVDDTAARPRANSRFSQPILPSAQGSYFDLEKPASSAPNEYASRRESTPSSRPGMYDRPRRTSASSDVSNPSTTDQSMSSRASYQARERTASWSSQASFDSYYSANTTLSTYGDAYDANEYPGQRPNLIKQQRRKSQPGQLFAMLPGEVLELILDELRLLHFVEGSKSCATCWMRNVCAVELSARKWVKYARSALYQQIQLVGQDSPQQCKRYKAAFGSRIMLLRRSLRANPMLAELVRSVKVPALPQGVKLDAYEDLVASLVMACPKLERLEGFFPTYDHSFKRIFNALSTRQHLKQMTWLVGSSEPMLVAPKLQKRVSGTLQKNIPDYWRQSLLMSESQPQRATNFLQYHSNWQQLTTLEVHFQPGANFAPAALFTDTLSSLPRLQNLYISHLPADIFNDSTLVSLPPLRKLSLSHTQGITSTGLSAFATRSVSRSIHTLTLVHAGLNSLPALARIFSNLSELSTFSLVQQYPPHLPRDEIICLFPYLASGSLRSLHWDFTDCGSSKATTADAILARSIAAHGFPSLTRLRAPNDPDGMFQSLCRPVERADLPTDKFQIREEDDGGGGHPPANRNATAAWGSDLLLARLAAQARVEAARKKPRFCCNVIDEYSMLVERYGLGGFVGAVGSRIRYDLGADEGARDERGGLVGVEEYLGDCGEALVLPPPPPPRRGAGKAEKEKEKDKNKEKGIVREGCTGRWNTWAGAGVMVDKKDRERWWHAERGRWKNVQLA